MFYEIYKQDDLYVLFAWTTLGYFRYKKFTTKEGLSHDWVNAIWKIRKGSFGLGLGAAESLDMTLFLINLNIIPLKMALVIILFGQ